MDSRFRGNDNESILKNAYKEMTMKRILILSVILIMAGLVSAKVDLTTLPTRETVQITIYNSADMTLVRESRPLTLKEGGNKLQFSWENTLIDPTSLEMLPKANADKIQISELSYPPRVKNLGLWDITSGVAGKVPVEITYLTSGLSWRAFYMGTMTPDEKTMSPELGDPRVRPPNSSWTVKSWGNTTVTELPGVFGLPRASTGKDMTLRPIRKSRSVEPPASTRSNLRSNEVS